MLVLTRKNNEAVAVGGTDAVEYLLKIIVLDIRNGRVRLGFEAGKDVLVHRWEVWQKTHSDDQPQSLTEAPAARLRDEALTLYGKLIGEIGTERLERERS